MQIIIDLSEPRQTPKMLILTRRHYILAVVVVLLFLSLLVYGTARVVAHYQAAPMVASASADIDRQRLWVENMDTLKNDIAFVNERLLSLQSQGSVLADYLGISNSSEGEAESFFVSPQSDDILDSLCLANEEEQSPEEKAANLVSYLYQSNAALTTLTKKMNIINEQGIRQNVLAHTVPVKRPIGGHNWLVSGYGYRKDPFSGRRAFHAGWDYAARKGTPIFAAASGIVLFAGRIGNYGNTVHIYHGDDISTLYGHMSAIDVKVWDYVEQGELIGKVGSTGRSTGPHLHYEIRVKGKPRPINKTIKALTAARNLS